MTSTNEERPAAAERTGEAFGFEDALRAAQASIDESRRVLDSYDSSKTPCAEEPIHIDSKRLAVQAYKNAVERVKARFWTTTFLASGFWSGTDTADILGANLRMMDSGRHTGAVVRRLFLLAIPPGEEIQRLQDERMLLRKAQDLDGLARFDQRIANLSDNIARLFEHGCDVRVVHDPERLHRHLPAELGVDPFDTEIAIYDDWRFDLFQGGRSGTIDSVRGYTPVMKRFDAHRDTVVEYFEQLWERSRPIQGFLDRLHRAVEESSTRIDYDTSWLARYDHALQREDEALKMEELIGVRVDLVRLERWGRIRRFLDVGTCTGRYPVSLRDAVEPDGLIMGVDNDIDCVRFTQAKVRRLYEDDGRFLIERHDFCTPELPSEQGFDLITCMMGTICHFERRPAQEPAAPGARYDDAFQRTLEKFARLLVKGGILFFSVWTEKACRDLRLLGIYTDENMQQLADKAAIPQDELRQRLELAGLRVCPPIQLQDRMELYRCERPQ